MKTLDQATAKASGLKTKKGAQARLDKVAHAVPHSTGFVFGREDGLFVPVVIIDHRDLPYAMLLATDGIFVTN